MKTLVKAFLSKFSSSQIFYGFLEKLYNYATLKRFQQVNRNQLVSLNKLSRPSLKFDELNLIRIGSLNDGGYVMEKPSSSGATVISLGIADNMDFESELIDSGLVRDIYCFDGSISELPEVRSNIYFESKFVRTAASRDSVTLNEILDRVHSDELILKIDIEGDEWSVLAQLQDKDLLKFSQIIGEFHGLASSLKEEDGAHKIDVLNKLHSHFHLVNAHPNNWSQYRIIQGVPLSDVIELSFINKSNASISEAKSYEVNFAKSNESLNSPCNPVGFEYLT